MIPTCASCNCHGDPCVCMDMPYHSHAHRARGMHAVGRGWKCVRYDPKHYGPCLVRPKWWNLKAVWERGGWQW